LFKILVQFVFVTTKVKILLLEKQKKVKKNMSAKATEKSKIVQ